MPGRKDPKIADRTDKELLVDLLAKREWLRRNPTGIAALTTKRRIKEIERELESRGVDLDAPKAASSRPRLGLSIWYVAVNDKGQPRQRIHADRGCVHLNDTRLQGVREANEAEIARLPVCSTCG
jgi:hypothetical protein